MARTVEIILVLVTLTACLTKAEPCQLENEAKLTEAYKSCTESTKFELPKMLQDSDLIEFLNKMEKTLEDKCFSKCVGEKLKLITSDNKLDRKALSNVMKFKKSNEPVTKAFEEIWNSCADQIESKTKDEKDTCKIAAMFKVCLLKTAFEKRDKMPKCDAQ